MARYPWPANAGPYRTIDNLYQPWIPSPVIPDRRPPLHHTTSTNLQTSGHFPRSGPRPPLAPERDRGASARGQFWRWLKACIESKKSHRNGRSHYDRDAGDGPIPHRLRPSDWRAFVYWAQPVVNHVRVNNNPKQRRRPPTSQPPNAADPGRVFRSLIGNHNSPHPERWVPGLRHPSLPTRPPLWRSPQHPMPPPWECQLNPFLEHRSIGIPPLYFDIGRETTGILFAEPQSTIPIDDGDRAQPATFPLLSEMHIRAIADDSSPNFPWPITVRNARGITCQDVFMAIYRNFQEYVTGQEFGTWSSRRKEQCSRAYHLRVRSADAWNPDQSLPLNDGLRRIDYMGERVMFRGLEPSPNRDLSWIMFVGPA